MLSPTVNLIPVADLTKLLATPSDRPRLLATNRSAEVEEWLKANNVPYYRAHTANEVMLALTGGEHSLIVAYEALLMCGWQTRTEFDTIFFGRTPTHNMYDREAIHLQVVHRNRVKPAQSVTVVIGHEWKQPACIR